MLSGHVAGAAQRRDLAERLLIGGRILGIFREVNPVGDLVVNRVSETQVELGWFVMPSARSQGIAENAVKALLPVLEQRGIEEVGARAFSQNRPSLRLMEKLGFTAVDLGEPLGEPLDWVQFTAKTSEFAMGTPSP